MNILLINPPGTVSFVSPPLGLLCIAGLLNANNHNVHIVDYNIEELDYPKFFNFIREKEINAVGISIVTPNVYTSMELSVAIRKKIPEIIIIAGGPHATLMPEQLLTECTAINYVIQGEGEFRMLDLITSIENRKPVDEMDGLAFMKDNNITNNSLMEDMKNITSNSSNIYKIININGN